MTQTYSQIQQKIAKLQKEADALRQKEMGGVIARIKVAIDHYGLTAEHLGFGGAKIQAKPLGKAASSGKYSDGNGQTWSGRGPRPYWLRNAIAGGASLESFLVASGVSAPTSASASSKSVYKSYKRAPSKLLYQDGAGNSWTGRGPQPRWLKEAVSAGRPLESFLGSSGTKAATTKAAVAPTKSKPAQPAEGRQANKSLKRRPSSVLYRDGTGNSWTGRGPQPRWLKDALAGGKTLEDLKR
jgi:DNA-binding protein H-NS